LGQNLSAQTSAYNTGVNAKGEVTGALIGAGTTAAFASDRRLKKNIVQVGQDEATGLNLYEFEYIDGDGSRYVGVMADEVLKVRPDAVHTNADGFMAVNYSAIGIEMIKVAKE
jgi:hypothetical protein